MKLQEHGIGNKAESDKKYTVIVKNEDGNSIQI